MSITKKRKAVDLRLRRHYGITLEEYERVLKLQGGKCAVCRLPVRGKRLAVDHCHKTGKLYGLLCFRCNKFVVGGIHGWAAAIIEYLTQPPFTRMFGSDRFTAPGKVGSKKRAKLLDQLQRRQ